MRMATRLRFGIALIVGMGCGAGLQADPLSAPCVANTLTFYEASFNTYNQCSVGILNFQGFSFVAAGTGDALLLNSSQIMVTPNLAGALGGGLSFSAVDPSNAPLAVGANQSATYFIDFFFEFDAGQVANSGSLGLAGSFGDVSVNQAYCSGLLDGRDTCSTGFQTLDLESPSCLDPIHNPNSCTTARSFSPPIQGFANVVTTIILTGSGTAGAGLDAASGGTSIQSRSAPEPISGMLVLGGLAAVFVSRFRFVRRSDGV